jgi:hypothetical protein
VADREVLAQEVSTGMVGCMNCHAARKVSTECHFCLNSSHAVVYTNFRAETCAAVAFSRSHSRLGNFRELFLNSGGSSMKAVTETSVPSPSS